MQGPIDFLTKELNKLVRLNVRDPDEAVFTVALDCWHYALMSLNSVHHQYESKQEKMLDALRLGYTHWFNLTQQAQDAPDEYMQIKPYMYAFGLKVLFDTMTDLSPEKSTAIHGALESFINENKDNREMFPDELFIVQTPTDDEIKDALDKADDNLLKDFFNALKDVGVYHNDLFRYKDPEQRKKAVRLYALYTQIMNLN